MTGDKPPFVPYGADFYKEHPKLCDPKDYWGQVKRSVGGRPVDAAQIQLIVDAAVGALDVNSDDVLLDICCGNGALTSQVAAGCAGAVGIDFSEPLIRVAQADFETDRHRYVLTDALSWLQAPVDPEAFTIALCYGSLSYLPRAAAEEAIANVHRNFPNIRRLFLGNLPNRETSSEYYADRHEAVGRLDQHDTQIGVWYAPEEFVRLGENLGWSVEIKFMPDHFFARKYRFDALLHRR
jgi:hypothetical protein